ncbi:MAG: NAD(+)/NADH kinase [Bacilli bacterium]|nr:NAD(+)/NADH kinase [Bacilli bacterium]
MKFYLSAKTLDLDKAVRGYFSNLGEITDLIDEADVLVSIGGDGTLLTLAQKAIKYDKPLLGINAGHVGYLCAYKIEELSYLGIDDFKKLKESKRTLIEVDNHYAVNDICILKENPIQAIDVDVKDIAFWKGDGVIVSTATGSSSYNLSAGGPLLQSESTDLIVTPICPNHPKKGPQIIKGEEIIINVSNRTPALLSYDNNILGPIENTVIIKRSKKTLKLLQK